jgi:hypothetical protein
VSCVAAAGPDVIKTFFFIVTDAAEKKLERLSLVPFSRKSNICDLSKGHHNGRRSAVNRTLDGSTYPG